MIADIIVTIFSIAILLPTAGGLLWLMLQFYRFVYWGLKSFSMSEPDWNYLSLGWRYFYVDQPAPMKDENKN
jgi:hypothetical protein